MVELSLYLDVIVLQSSFTGGLPVFIWKWIWIWIFGDIIIIIFQGIGHSWTVLVQSFNFWTYESIWITQHRKTWRHIHALSGIWTCDPNVWAVKDSMCLRLCGHWDQLFGGIWCIILVGVLFLGKNVWYSVC